LIALEVGAAGGASDDDVVEILRSTVRALLRLDPSTRYRLCYRLSRASVRRALRPIPSNAQLRLLFDPFNGLLLAGDRLLHSLGGFVPRTPRIPKLLTVADLGAVRDPGWGPPRRRERLRARMQLAVSRADHVVTYSAFTAGEVRSEYDLPDERVHAVLPGVDADAFQPPDRELIRRTRERFCDYALAIGGCEPRRNLVRLVPAIAPLGSLRLVHVGRAGAASAAVYEAVMENGMQDRFVTLQDVAHVDRVALLGAARVYAVPSLYDGTGAGLLEAMACGAPVVCSRAAALPEVAGDAASLVDATDVQALEHAIRRVVEDTDRAEALRARGLARARELSWEASARRLRGLYHAVAGIE
jgi:glycosyltransferase involved in cell wall biosynthesis